LLQSCSQTHRTEKGSQIKKSQRPSAVIFMNALNVIATLFSATFEGLMTKKKYLVEFATLNNRPCISDIPN